MEKKKFWIHFSIIATLGIVPFLALGIMGFVAPHKYSDTFYAGLVVKDDRLEKASGKKIVFLGGSSLSFGLRSDLMSQALGYEVVDYGLYAPLGIKTMAELARKKIGKGDIVIFAPEINKETYSTNMDYQMFLKASEDKPDLFNRFDWDTRNKIIYNFLPFAEERYISEVNPTAPYDKASFNSYGDIYSDVVTQNIMPEFYDSGQKVIPDKSFLNKEFINYMNDYARRVAFYGATTYFTFSPTNTLALVKDNLSEFESGLKSALNFSVLGSVEELTYHQNYFYDTNYHLNYAGTIEHSKKLVSLLSEKLGITVEYTNFPELKMPKALFEEEEEPEPEPEPEVEPSYKVELHGNQYYLVGIGSDLSDAEVIWVPEEVDGHTITGVYENAFLNMKKVKNIILPNTIDSLSNGAFSGCDALQKIYLTNTSAPANVMNGLLDGCPSTTRIAILRSARMSYLSGYTWREYKDKFSLYNLEDLEQFKEN